MARPAIYRWIVWSGAHDIVELYIGETKHLGRRLANYLKPGSDQQTNIRVRALLDDALTRGGRVTLEVLDFEPFQLDQRAITEHDLADTPVRRFIEQLLLASMAGKGIRTFNA